MNSFTLLFSKVLSICYKKEREQLVWEDTHTSPQQDPIRLLYEIKHCLEQYSIFSPVNTLEVNINKRMAYLNRQSLMMSFRPP